MSALTIEVYKAKRNNRVLAEDSAGNIVKLATFDNPSDAEAYAAGYTRALQDSTPAE